MNKSNNNIYNKIGVSNKDPIPTPISCCIKMGTLGEIEGSRYRRVPLSIGLTLTSHEPLQSNDQQINNQYIKRMTFLS